MSDERKKIILIRTEHQKEVILNLKETQSFTLAMRNTPKDKQKKFQLFYKFYMYLGEHKLILGEINHIRATYPTFNLTHLYK